MVHNKLVMLAFAYIAAFTFVYFANSAVININPKTRHFIDQFSRTRIFHGVNVVYKASPYVPLLDKFDPMWSLSSEDYDYLINFGFNTVRLGIIWEAVEVAPGVYNDTYLDIYENLINDLGRRGIYTVLDNHQDVFSRLLCGEGVPLFYLNNITFQTECSSLFQRILAYNGICLTYREMNLKKEPNEIPLMEECKKRNFAHLHMTVDLGSIYELFYTNINGLMDKFVEYWKVVAKKMKNNPYIIGYDIWNEPWVGNLHSSVKNFILPGYYTNKIFLPFFKKVDEEIREIDKDFVMMFEEALFPDTIPVLGGLYFGGYNTPPAGKDLLHKQIWSMHHYCFGLSHEMTSYKVLPVEIAKNDCRRYADYKLSKSKHNADLLGVPIFLTEFGACKESESCYFDITATADASDKQLLSWQYWAYKPYGDHSTQCSEDEEGVFNLDGSIQQLKIKALTRPYMLAFQGDAIKSFYYTKLNLLHVRLHLNAKIDAPSVIYHNRKIFYPNGNKLTIVSTQNSSIEDDHFLIKVFSHFSLIEEDYTKNYYPIDTWDQFYEISIDHNYLYVQLLHEKDNSPSPVVIDMLLTPRIEYTVIQKKEHISLSFTAENLDKFGYLNINAKANQSVILITQEQKEKEKDTANYEIIIDYPQMPDVIDLDEIESSTQLVKIFSVNEPQVIQQLYISQLHVHLYKDKECLFEIEIKNIVNSFLKINFSFTE